MQGDREYTDFVAFTSRNRSQLTRMDTNSSISTNATAPNLPGAGRTVGLLIDRLGSHVENLLNIGAQWRKIGPKAVAQDIRRILRHDQTTFAERFSRRVVQLSKRDERDFRKMCKRLLKYARFRII